jgi:tetraacyldisaccharide-1-P 4'-kinase
MQDQPINYEDAEKEAYKILHEFLEPTNIAMKSEIHNVLALVKLQMLANYLKADGYPKTAKDFQDFVDTFLLFMTSKDRGRVKEICEALSAMNLQRRETLSLAQKLMSSPPPTS